MFPIATNKFSQRAKALLESATRKATALGATQVDPLHLLLALLEAEGALGHLLLRNLGIRPPHDETTPAPDEEEASDETISTQKNNNAAPTHATETLTPPISSTLPFSTELKKLIVRAFALAHQARSPYVGTEHLAHALLELPTSVLAAMFIQADLNAETLTNIAARAQHFAPNLPQLEKLFSLTDGAGPIHKHADESPTPYLDQFGIDFMDLPESDADLQKLQFRTQEVERMIHILGRRRKNNPLLIGEPGVGKTTLVHALAQRILDGSAGALLDNKRIVGIDLASIVAGTNFRGEFESRLKEIIREAAENPEIILFIDEIHTLVGAGNVSGGLDAANILKPALSRGDIQCIGATTLAEHKRSIEKDPALERRFQPIVVTEPTASEALAILKESRKQYEQFHHLSLPVETLQAAIELSVRYIPDRFLPDKAFDLIDEAASFISYQHQPKELLQHLRETEEQLDECLDLKEEAITTGNYEAAEKAKRLSEKLEGMLKKIQDAIDQHFRNRKLAVLPEHIVRVIARMTHIPLEKLSLAPTDRITRLQETLERTVVGQSETLAEISNALIRSYSGVSSPDRPLGSFLFLGPSGVGKTLTAKILASTLFENKDALIRLDMSEFMERHTVAQMIGAPPGYVGFGEGGKLTEKVRRQPYSIVLFDEIEKAHPDIFNLLLQILDEGYLTDAEGRRVSFRNTIIILTSNIGTQAFNQTAKIGFQSSDAVAEQSFETVREQVLSELRHRLRPELLGRLDHTIVFKPLRAEHFRQIAEHDLDSLKQRLAVQKVSLRIAPDVIDFLATVGTNPQSGARLIRQKIQTLVETPIAKTLITVSTRPITLALTLSEGRILCTPVVTKKSTPRKKLVQKKIEKKKTLSKKQ